MNEVKFLINLRDNFEIFFADKLLEALNMLLSNKFGKLFDDLKHGISKVYEYFKKWIDLPLIIC